MKATLKITIKEEYTKLPFRTNLVYSWRMKGEQSWGWNSAFAEAGETVEDALRREWAKPNMGSRNIDDMEFDNIRVDKDFKILDSLALGWD